MNMIRKCSFLLIVILTLFLLLSFTGTLFACERCVTHVNIPDPNGGPGFQIALCLAGFDSGAELCRELTTGTSCILFGNFCQWSPV